MKSQEIEQSQSPNGGGVRPLEEGISSKEERVSSTDHQEAEWQFDGADLDSVEGWLEEGHEDLSIFVETGEKKELTDVYYDTEDWKLYRTGYTLRIRKLDRRRYEATIESLASATSSDDARRREISEPLGGEEPDVLLSKKRPGSVGKPLKALVGTWELRPLFEVRTRRRTFELFEVQSGGADGSVDGRDNDSLGEVVQDASGNIRREGVGSRIGEVALDESEIPLEDESVRLARVEVEGEVSGVDAPLGLVEDFAGAIKEKFELWPATASKYECGLLARGLDPERDLDLGPTTVEKTLSVGELAFRVLRRQFATMRAHEGGTRLGEDPEELHDMRVATRRMRSALKFFEDALPEEAEHFRRELKFFAGVLGAVRDLDVQIEQLWTWISEADEEDSEHLSKTINVLEKRRAAAREDLLEALDSGRYERFESSFAEFLQRGPAAGGYADKSALAVAPYLLSQPYRKWRKAAKRVDETSHSEDYHDLRKKGKCLRYALEFLSGVYGEKATGKIVKPLKELQDVLGRHQDLFVSGDLLRQLATEGRKLPPRTAFAMGVLTERNLQDAGKVRASLPTSKAYRKLTKGKAWESFEKAMKKRS